MEHQFGKLRSELSSVRKQAVAAHISGDKARAECLTGKAVGMKSTLEVAERLLQEQDPEAKGELEGMERVLQVLAPLPKC